jgi:hypothetical protein
MKRKAEAPAPPPDLELCDEETTLDHVHTGLLRVEALTHAARHSMEFLPPAGARPRKDLESRRAIERIYALVTMAAEEAEDLLDWTDEARAEHDKESNA